MKKYKVKNDTRINGENVKKDQVIELDPVKDKGAIDHLVSAGLLEPLK